MKIDPCNVFQRQSYWDGQPYHNRQYSRSYHLGTLRKMETAIMLHDPFQYHPALRSVWGF